MNAPRFTPGPWFEDRRRDRSSNAVDILGDKGEWTVGSIINEGALTDVDHANARLIAAAPELYEALRNIENFAGYGPVAVMARDALAKVST